MNQDTAIQSLFFYPMEAVLPIEIEKKERKRRKKSPISLVHFTRKSIGVIHISNDLTLNERKVANLLIKNAQDIEKEIEGFDKRDKFFIDSEGNMYYKSSFEEIEELLGMKKHEDRDYIRQILHSLASTALRYNILNRDNTNKRGWEEIMALFPYVKYKLSDNDPDSTVYYYFSSMVKDVVIKPALYAPIDLNIQKNLKSTHSLALFEYLSSELAVNQTDEVTTKPIELANYVYLVAGSKIKYDEFKYINRDLIEKPLEEINKKSPIIASPIAHKKGRKVSAISLHIKMKEGYTTPLLDVNVNPTLQTALKKEESFAVESKEKEREDINNLLISNGVGESKRKNIISKYSDAHIQANLSEALKWAKQKEIPEAGIPAAIIKAITKNWANHGATKVEIGEKNALLSRLSIMINSKVNHRINVKQSTEYLGDALYLIKKAEKITEIHWLDTYYAELREKFDTVEGFCRFLKSDFQNKVKEVKGILLSLKEKYGLALVDILKKWDLRREDLFSNMLTTEDEFIAISNGLKLD